MNEFEKLVGFKLDHFQIQAIDYLQKDISVVVCAPTGSGKSLIGFWACFKAIEDNQRCFYTTPIKALSNQKRAELSALFPDEPIGLLTGDHSINPDASVVVMTTEVLRNMIYATSDNLTNLKYVVLDELHFIQDPYRGGIWEEIILQGPKDVVFACLSATATNASELASWIEFVHGPARPVSVRERPVPLENLLAVKIKKDPEVNLIKILSGKSPSKAVLQINNISRSKNPYLQQIYKAPSIYNIVATLKEQNMLPAIWFVFSRSACDSLAQGFLTYPLVLTDDFEREIIRQTAESLCNKLDPKELNALKYSTFLATIERGIAPHHAGMPVIFKETVETLFAKGLIKFVIATETLATGINMPAKTVIIERLTKRDEAGHRALKPWEFTQMTGRAGRRSIDTKGYAIVPYSRWLSIKDLLLYCQKSSFEVKSAFKPTYNTVANLAKRMTKDEAFALISNSLAAFQTRRPLIRELKKVITMLNNHQILDDFNLTQYGYQLCDIYHELDLVILKLLKNSVLQSIDIHCLTGVLAALCFEPRHKKIRLTKMNKIPIPDRRLLQEALDETYETTLKIRHEEKNLGLLITRDISFVFVDIAIAWFENAPLDEILTCGISPGDLVRSMRQIIDLAKSLAKLEPQSLLEKNLLNVASSLDRSIVAFSML